MFGVDEINDVLDGVNDACRHARAHLRCVDGVRTSAEHAVGVTGVNDARSAERTFRAETGVNPTPADDGNVSLRHPHPLRAESPESAHRAARSMPGTRPRVRALEGYLAHKKLPPHGTLQ